MVLVQSDHVVQMAASEGTVHPLQDSVLPGRTKSGDLPLDPQGCQERFKAGEDWIPVVNEVSDSCIGREGLPELLAKPFACGVGGDVEMPDNPPSMVQEDKDVEGPEVPGGNHQEVHGGEDIAMVPEEDAPRPAASFEVLVNHRPFGWAHRHL
jgi:hypothetical protein